MWKNHGVGAGLVAALRAIRQPTDQPTDCPYNAVFPHAIWERLACADCDKIAVNECLPWTAACAGGGYLLPYCAPGACTLAGDVSSTRSNGLRWRRFIRSQSREFATPTGGRHRADLRRLSDDPAQSGPAGDRIPAVARSGFSSPPASFLPG